MSYIKTDNIKTLVNALEEIERLQGRCEELETERAMLMPIVKELADDVENEVEARRGSELDRRIERDLLIVKEARAALSGNSGAWLLRKQAEAIEDCASYFGGRDFVDVRFIISEHAQRLRQQAEEIENGL